jgi:hypothetical protein
MGTVRVLINGRSLREIQPVLMALIGIENALKEGVQADPVTVWFAGNRRMEPLEVPEDSLFRTRRSHEVSVHR